MCGMPEIHQKGARRVEYGWWHIERGWGASNKVGGTLKVARLCRKWPGHAERGRELLEGWEYVGGCVGLVERGGARWAGAGVRWMGWGALDVPGCMLGMLAAR